MTPPVHVSRTVVVVGVVLALAVAGFVAVPDGAVDATTPTRGGDLVVATTHDQTDADSNEPPSQRVGTLAAGIVATGSIGQPPTAVSGLDGDPAAAASVPSDVVLASDVQIERTQVQGAPGDTVTVTVELSDDGSLSSGDRLGGYLFVGGLNAGMLDRVLVVEDDPDDDRIVNVTINTFEIGRTPTAKLTVSNSGYATDASGSDNDLIESVSRPRPPEVADQLVDELPGPLPEGTYKLRASTSETVRANDDNGGTLIFPDRTDVANLYLAEESGSDDGFQPSITIDPRRPEPSDEVTFDASGSTSPTGDIYRYEWDFDNDGEVEAEGKSVTHTFEESGEHLVGVRLTDTNGNDEVVGRTVVVNTPPDPTITVSTETATVGEAVWFDAGDSTDPDGYITDFEWDLDGDRTFERTGTRIERTFDSSGTYNVTLFVTDDLNGTATATAEVEVVNPTPTPTETPTLTATPTTTATVTATTTRTTTVRPETATTAVTTTEDDAGAGGLPLIPMAGLATLVVVGAGGWYRHSSGGDGGGAVAAGDTGGESPSGGGTAAAAGSAGAAAGGGAGSPSDGSDDRRGPPDSIPSARAFDFEYDDITREERIGAGGNADVSRAVVDRSDGTETTIALKEPRIDGTLSTEVIDRFRREAETWAKLDDHDHVVGVLDYGTEPIPWLAMEYMDGGNLATAIDDRAFEEALWDAIKISEGVRHAHRRGVAHLDLKPANVLFRETGPDSWDVPKVGDWGLARMLLDHSHSVEGMSPHYAAPEQFDADTYGEPDDVTDVYQLGVVFYELFTGEQPFDGPPSAAMHSVLEGDVTPPTEVDPSLPSKVDDVILTAMAQQKDDRYESVLYLRDELQGLYDSL